MISLQYFARQHPHTGRLRRRRDRRLGAIHPSRPAMIAYAAALGQLVDYLRRAGLEVVQALRPHWPQDHGPEQPGAHDAAPPTIRHEVGRVRATTHPKVVGAAPGIATRVVRANLGSVDDKLSSRVNTSLGIQIRQGLIEHGPIAGAMNDALADNVDLIESISSDYFDELETILADNWANVGDWRDAVEAVGDLGDVTQSRAELIARDQTNKLNAKFNEVRQTSIGVKKYEWVTVGDDRVRPAHEELDGSEHDWDNPPTDSDGETGHPGEAIQCRCASDPILDLDEDPDADAGGGGGDEEEPDDEG